MVFNKKKIIRNLEKEKIEGDVGYAKLEVEVGCKLYGRWLHGYFVRGKLEIVEN